MNDKPIALQAIRECEIHDVGAFKLGDIISDPNLVDLLTDHPAFKPFNKVEEK